jgi:hypothetical protein
LAPLSAIVPSGLLGLRVPITSPLSFARVGVTAFFDTAKATMPARVRAMCNGLEAPAAESFDFPIREVELSVFAHFTRRKRQPGCTFHSGVTFDFRGEPLPLRGQGGEMISP